ncbi:hypothetical protein MKX47_21145 [Solibacillus sp. FSL R7-0668]|uniref:hypothetical protein n=1 Tax=Solibacillus sp. FSL R7-0668 TaxID=2921688 RepID=UPI0030FBEDC5
MIKFYIDEEYGIEMGGMFLQGDRVLYVDSEEEARNLNDRFNNKEYPCAFNDLPDWGIHQLTPLQLETFLKEKTLYKL